MGSISPNTGSFHFLRDLDIYHTEKPYEIWRESDPSIPKSNCKFEEHTGIAVHNMREQHPPGLFDYEGSGFRFLHAPPQHGITGEDCQAVDPSPRLQAYLEESIETVKEQLDASNVICFDWRVLSSSCLPLLFMYTDV